MTLLTALDDAVDCLGHVPEPVYDYLAWILVTQTGTPAHVELGRLIGSITAGEV